MQFGFRPASLEIPLGAPVDLAHGVNPKEPQTTLEVPSPEVMNAITQLWQEHKKRSSITLVFDVSGSMKGDNKIENARAGALELLKVLDDRDAFALEPFSDTILEDQVPVELSRTRETARAKIESLFADGGTRLYDAIAAAYQRQTQSTGGASDKIKAVVVLTDGADTRSKLTLDGLLSQIQLRSEAQPIRVFTIGYGTDAQKNVLQTIADATQAKFYVGTPENIREVFKDISTFF